MSRIGRRRFIGTTLIGGAAVASQSQSTRAAAPTAEADPSTIGRTPNTKFAVNVEMWWSRLPFLQRVREAAALGFPAIEFWPWESKDVDDLNLYDRIRKVEPMKRALEEIGARAWLSGLRSEQTEFRRTLSPVRYDGDRYKVLPILNWTSKDVYDFLTKYDLPYHPLFDEDYATVGDAHSSAPAALGQTERGTRFRGLKEECGLHF